MPQIENMQNNGFDLTNTKILADSVYGTNEALEYLEKNGLDDYIPSRKQSTMSKKHPDENPEKYHKYDFFYDYEKDTFKCSEGVELKREKEYKDGSVKYCNKEGCSECPNESKSKCTTKKYRIMIDKKTIQQKEMEEKMYNEESKEIYKKRTTVERTIANIKKGFNYRYTNYSGKEKVKAELTAHAVVHNLRKVFNEAVKTSINSGISVIEVIETLV
ncbi:MAG: transposase [Methanobrevibacter sp.]|jgi:hypothetical protein|nr:transposase [Methanobrevibacter sp.]